MKRTYIIFLRGVNVSGKNLLNMSSFKTELLKVGFEKVVTYIQSGNLVIQTAESKEEVARKINDILEQKFSISTTIFVLSIQELKQAEEHNPYKHLQFPNRIFLTFVNEIPNNLLLENLTLIDHGKEEFAMINEVLYFHLPEGMGNAKLNNNYFEKKLKITATGRNLNTINKMIDLANSL